MRMKQYVLPVSHTQNERWDLSRPDKLLLSVLVIGESAGNVLTDVLQFSLVARPLEFKYWLSKWVIIWVPWKEAIESRTDITYHLNELVWEVARQQNRVLPVWRAHTKWKVRPWQLKQHCEFQFQQWWDKRKAAFSQIYSYS